MKRVLKALSAFFMLVTVMSLSACAANGGGAQTNDTDSKSGHIKSTTAITEVFGEGQKVTAVAVEYDKDIDNSKLKESAFSVDGRTITKVYANNEAAKAEQGINGKYVIIELSTDDKGSSSTFAQSGGSSTRTEAKVSL